MLDRLLRGGAALVSPVHGRVAVRSLSAFCCPAARIWPEGGTVRAVCRTAGERLAAALPSGFAF